MKDAERQSHAYLDLSSRHLKGLKIERLLTLANREQPIRMLEVGTGSGGVAHYFGTHPTLICQVDAVDVSDSRQVTQGFRYHVVNGTKLPFENEQFDVVLTNHVIEHVGDEIAQKEHLAEVRRVLRQDGVGYLAVPNRWMLVEPHYRLAFLSWLPHGLRSPYLKWRRGKSFYDCEPLTRYRLESFLRAERFRFENKCLVALRLTLDVEYAPDTPMQRVFRYVPDGLIEAMNGMSPTLIYKIWRDDS